MPRHVAIKPLGTKDKKILKAVRKMTTFLQGKQNLNDSGAEFSSESMEVTKPWQNVLQVLRNPTPSEDIFQK